MFASKLEESHHLTSAMVLIWMLWFAITAKQGFVVVVLVCVFGKMVPM